MRKIEICARVEPELAQKLKNMANSLGISQTGLIKILIIKLDEKKVRELAGV